MIKTSNDKIKGLGMVVKDIDMCHRLGRPGDRARPIIVRYISRMDRNTLLKRRRELKGTHIYVNEDLTKLNRLVLGYARRQLAENESVWTREGKLFYKSNTGNIRCIHFHEYADWTGFSWPRLIQKSASNV